MPESLKSQEIVDAFKAAATASLSPDPNKRPVASPADWRDQPIYFLMADRFNNPTKPPKHKWDQPFGEYQGGTFNGVKEKLDYIKGMGFGAIWLSPIQKNLSWESFS